LKRPKFGDTAPLRPPGLAFHPNLACLAIASIETDFACCIWDVDIDILLDQTATDSVRYTTAKLVLVGDSGVGKTGLGWRLAHGEFKEHASTHGQQFWVIPELGKTRDDGTECEAVLWDLAGQHVYRPIHSIFLDNVDASLVLFDPTNRQDPLKGAEFWLEQLRGKGKLPPGVLVGARVDRGEPVLTQEELEQFCQRYGISGGYLSTSAKKDIGLDELMAVLQSQIPWDEMTTTVTTITFKRIKDYVLSLKEQPDRENVLVDATELRQQLQATDAEWSFSDAEMMTAVGHLETHGYVTILRTAAGQQSILLIPELLVDLVSSIVLEAGKHPRALGSLSETRLVQGDFAFDELVDLDKNEQEILLDAAVLRFLEHDVCFRETLGAETLLIFPGLIRQKRPLFDEFEAIEDTSYIVRGAVENVYAALVVLLGYTRTFTRINQWENQAQYEMGEGEICGFRQIEERAGEIELILYYAATTPTYVRTMFQGLFEKFLYQRDVDVTRYPPVFCADDHLQERATVIKWQRQGRDSLFCPECGQKVDLPRVEEALALGERDCQTVTLDENLARLRRTYEMHLSRVKGFRRDRIAPRCYISHVPKQASWVSELAHDLRDAGSHVLEDRGQVQGDDFILLVDTPPYRQSYHDRNESIAADAELIDRRLKHSGARHSTVIPLLLEGDPSTPLLQSLNRRRIGDFREETRYAVSLFDLVLTLYAIPFNHPAFKPLRTQLQRQWLQKVDRSVEEAGIGKEAIVGATGEDMVLQEIEATPERYIDFDLHVGPDGHTVASSIEGEAASEIPLEVPWTIPLSVKLIEKRDTDADMLEKAGRALYDWLFPEPIHTHFQQTEAVARRDNAKMRIRLRIEAEGIASLPLEFLYRETGGYFMAINPNTALSRYLNLSLPPERVRRREGPLHMLTIIADPADQPRLPPDEWEAIIEEALAAPLASGQMTLNTIKRATRKEIRNALLQQKPDIIQFVGHGVHENGKGYLTLVNDQTGETWLVDDKRFANLFLGHDDHLGLISLATCESGKSDDPQGFAGIAPQLVQRGVPAVLSMQYRVYIDAAKVFFEDFYTAVAARKPIDWATQSARNAISLEYGLDNREFAAPVLYMRAKDGNVF
jgi:small GTP-binding protein